MFHKWPEVERILRVDPPSITGPDAKETQTQRTEGRIVSASVTKLGQDQAGGGREYRLA